MTSLIDTDVLVYAAGIQADGARQRMAVDLLTSLRRDACLSLQVLSEFSAVALGHGLAPDACRAIVADYRRSWTVLVPSASTLNLALRAVGLHRLSFWDALIWAVAQEHGIAEILHEDGPAGAVIGPVPRSVPRREDVIAGWPRGIPKPRPHSPTRAMAASRIARTRPS